MTLRTSAEPIVTSVLLVDDHPFVLDGVAGVLDAQPDFRVVGRATSAPEAIAALRELRPALALIDLRLGEGDGREVLKAALADRWRTYTVVLSAFSTDDDILAAARLHARAYLLKTDDASTVVSTLRRVMQGENVLLETIPPALKDRLSMKDLSPKEMEVLRLLAAAASNKQIAQALGVTENTVKIHLRRIYRKLGVSSRSEATIVAIRRGF